jgi:protein subunit release factor B
MAALGLREADLSESFVLGSGKGGQKINKTASCVQLRHADSGIEVRCQRSRSRAVNRYWARFELCERVAEQREGERSQRQQRIEKIRRQKRRRSRRQKERMLEDKRLRSRKKALRRPVSGD